MTEVLSGMSCYLCCPPKRLRPDQGEIHVKMFHLGPYTPFKCPKCDDKQYSLERSFVTHAMLKHKTYTLTPLVRPSSYLDVLSKVMMQSNSYISNNQQESSIELMKNIKSVTAIQIEEPQIPMDDANIEQSEFSCQFCSMTFDRISKYRTYQDNRHNRVSTGAHRCPSCGKRYHYQSNLRVHARIHENKLPEANRTAQISSSLRLKFQDRPGNIKESRKSAGDRRILPCRKPMRHRACSKKPAPLALVPASERGETCRTCEQIFPTRSALMQHQIMSEHGRKIQSDSRHLHYCLVCERSICSSAKQHLAVFHVKKPVVGCSKCNYTHAWRLDCMRKHIRMIHAGHATIIDPRASINRELSLLENNIITKNPSYSDKRIDVEIV